jgi:hypothetical protein
MFMYGHQLFSIFERISALGIVDSQKDFSTRWCGKSQDLTSSRRGECQGQAERRGEGA